jgi:hypothetical protein
MADPAKPRFSSEIIAELRHRVISHNETTSDPVDRVSLGQLKGLYKRWYGGQNPHEHALAFLDKHLENRRRNAGPPVSAAQQAEGAVPARILPAPVRVEPVLIAGEEITPADRSADITTTLQATVIALRAELAAARAEISAQHLEIETLKARLPTEITPVEDDPVKARALIRALHRQHGNPLTEGQCRALDQLASEACGTETVSGELQAIAAITVGMVRGEAWYGSATTRKADLEAVAKDIERLVKRLNRLNFRILLAAIGSDDAPSDAPASGPVLTKSFFERKLALDLFLEILEALRRAVVRLAAAETPRPRGRPQIDDPVRLAIEKLALLWRGQLGRSVTGSGKAGEFGDLVHHFFQALGPEVATRQQVTTALRHFIADARAAAG